MPRFGAFFFVASVAVVANPAVVLAQPLQSAEVMLSCVWQSHGTGHETRSFDIMVDQQMQRVSLGGDESLPATISATKISFAINRGGSIFLYEIDRPSGFGTIRIKDQVLYSGTCKIGNPAART